MIREYIIDLFSKFIFSTKDQVPQDFLALDQLVMIKEMIEDRITLPENAPKGLSSNIGYLNISTFNCYIA